MLHSQRRLMISFPSPICSTTFVFPALRAAFFSSRILDDCVSTAVINFFIRLMVGTGTASAIAFLNQEGPNDLAYVISGIHSPKAKRLGLRKVISIGRNIGYWTRNGNVQEFLEGVTILIRDRLFQ